MKKFIKNNWFKIIIAVCVICLTFAIIFSMFPRKNNTESGQRGIWKPDKSLYEQGELVKYGVASFKILDKPTAYNSNGRILLIVKVLVKNSYDNISPIYISEQQFIIRDGENIFEPIVYDDDNFTPSIRGRSLDSGEEFLGYLFFEEEIFENPILEINPFKGSLPVKIKIDILT